MMTQELQKKIDRAIRLLQSIKVNDGEFIEVAYSGGKDSELSGREYERVVRYVESILKEEEK